MVLSLCWEGDRALSLGVLLSQLLLLEFVGSLVEAAGFLRTEFLSAACICCLSILQEPRRCKAIYKGSGSRGTSRIRGKWGRAEGRCSHRWRLGGWWLEDGWVSLGEDMQTGQEREGQRGTSSETGGWE